MGLDTLKFPVYNPLYRQLTKGDEMEKRKCAREGCGKEFKVHPFSLKKYCSQKCRQILWALREANKALKK